MTLTTIFTLRTPPDQQLERTRSETARRANQTSFVIKEFRNEPVGKQMLSYFCVCRMINILIDIMIDRCAK